MRGYLKRFFTICISVALSSSLLSQEVKIEGRIKSDRVVQIVLLNYSTGVVNVADSSKLNNGEFRFVHKLNEVTSATLIVLFKAQPEQKRGDREITQLYIEPGNIYIDIQDSVKFAVVSGSKSHLESLELKKRTLPYSVKMQEIVAQASKMMIKGDTENARVVGARFPAVERQMKDSVLLPYLVNNPASPIALSILQQYAGYDFDSHKIESIFLSFPESVRNSPSGVLYKDKIEIAKRVALGSYAHNFTQNDTLGNPVTLNSFRGKYLLLDFWASWCAPCRKENPNLVKAYNAFKDRNFTILGVSLDEPGKFKDWTSAIRKDGLIWTNVSDLNRKENEVAKLYGITNIPQNFLIDPQGKIIARNLKGEELHKVLDKILPQ